MDESDAALSKDQHRLEPLCLIGSADDVADFRSILNDIGSHDTPACSKLIEADVVGKIERSVSPESPRQLRVRFRLIEEGKTLVDLSSTGDWPGNESAHDAAHRLIERDRNYYVVKIGMVKW